MRLAVVVGRIVGSVRSIFSGRIRRPWRNLQAEFNQQVAVMTRQRSGIFQPIREVTATRRQSGQQNNTHALGVARQRLRRGQRLLSAGLVVILNNDDIAGAETVLAIGKRRFTASQCPNAACCPFAASRRRCAETQCGAVVGILFALANE